MMKEKTKQRTTQGIWRRAAAMLLACLVLFGVVDVTAFAEEPEIVASGNCGTYDYDTQSYADDVKWTLDANGLLTISGAGEMWGYDRGYAPWMKEDEQGVYNDTIKKIIIKSGVTGIGMYSFRDCRELESVDIADTVTEISLYGFINCRNLKKVTLREGIQTIGSFAFCNCTSLTEITIPDSVTNIYAGAFRGCSNLKSVTISGDDTAGIDWGTFRYCSSLESITVGENNTLYTSEDDVLFNKDKTELIKYPGGKAESAYEMPSGVTTIDAYAFEECSKLETVTIPDSVKKIETYAFVNSSVKSATIESKDVEITDKALGYTRIGDGPGESWEKKDDFVIYGYLGSTAEQYAKDHEIKFEELTADEQNTDNTNKTDDTPKTDDTNKTDDTPKTDDVNKTNDTDKSEDIKKSEDTGKFDQTTSASNIVSIDPVKGTAQIPDLVAGTNEEVPLAVVVEGAVYRMYNPNSGEHFYTKSSAERDELKAAGWNYEENASFATIAANEEGAKPVYRVYNPNSGLHHYTMNHEEAILLRDAGWNYEGISFYAFNNDSGIGSPQYRVYNPNDGQHHWTVDSNERDSLVSLGWNDEGIAWRVK